MKLNENSLLVSVAKHHSCMIAAHHLSCPHVKLTLTLRQYAVAPPSSAATEAFPPRKEDGGGERGSHVVRIIPERPHKSGSLVVG